MLKKLPPMIPIAFLFGTLAMLVLAVRFYIKLTPEIGMDGREIFLTLGAALTGPWGAVIMSILMLIGIEIGYPDNTTAATLLDTFSHLVSTILLAVIYRKVIYEKVKQPFRMLGWVVLVLAYYWVFLVLLAGVGYYAIGVFPSPLFLYSLPIWPEVIITIVVTVLILVAMPERWRKPLWGHPKSQIFEEKNPPKGDKA